MKSKRGSAIVGAVWILAVLSILIATYAIDAQLQTRVNLYLQERVRVDHLTDAGIAIAEVILLDYQNVTVPSGGNEGTSQTQLEEYLEKDRWYWEKVYLKDNHPCDTGAVPVDALNPDGGSVTVKIKPIESKWNINNLYPQGDANYAKIWEAILAASGVPEDYWDSIVNSWCDWRDSDSAVTSGARPSDEGAETEFYKEAYDDCINGRDVEKNKNYLPAARDGEISDLDDLIHLKGFNEYEDEPINAEALLDGGGGILNPLAKKDDQIEIDGDGLRTYFSVFGSGKININVADVDIISTIPGIWNPRSDDPKYFKDTDRSNAVMYAEAIVQIRDAVDPRNFDAGTIESGSEEKITSLTIVRDKLEKEVGGTIEIDWGELEKYVTFTPEKFFEVSIIGESLGITHMVKAIAIVDNGKVRYLRWQEDP